MRAPARFVGVLSTLCCAACGRLETLELFAPDAGSTLVIGAEAGFDAAPIPATPDAREEPPLSPLKITQNTNLSHESTGDRLCTEGGDAVGYVVSAADSDTLRLAQAPLPGCLERGDLALLVNLQGSAESNENVGTHELVRILAVSGNTVRLAQPKQRAYGTGTSDDDIGPEPGLQHVFLQRVPLYARLEVTEGSTLSANAWNGRGGGLLAIQVRGDVVVDGSIRMDGLGYRGGATIDPVESPGQQGESIEGPGEFLFVPNVGGGGGGIADQTTHGCQQDGYPGGGGAHVTAGQTAETMDLCDGIGAGEGGAPYGDPERLLLGSGGGSGGTDNVRSDNPPGGAGGPGGGIVWIVADSITGRGVISASGAAGIGDPEGFECDGSTRSCYDHSGPGGGGAGGTVRLEAGKLDVRTISAEGGRGGNGADFVAGNGGDGGRGLLALSTGG